MKIILFKFAASDEIVVTFAELDVGCISTRYNLMRSLYFCRYTNVLLSYTYYILYTHTYIFISSSLMHLISVMQLKRVIKKLIRNLFVFNLIKKN